MPFDQHFFKGVSNYLQTGTDRYAVLHLTGGQNLQCRHLEYRASDYGGGAVLVLSGETSDFQNAFVLAEHVIAVEEHAESPLSF